MLSIPLGACSRSQYRHRADKEAYCLIQSRQNDARWLLPGRAVEPHTASRLHAGTDVDCGPKPPDDFSASQLMNCPDGKSNSYYENIPTRPYEENLAWLENLPRQSNGSIPLTQELAVDLGLLHSREYQTQFENVYLTALELSGNRFEFDLQWFGGLGTFYTATGDAIGDNRRLDTTFNRLGFSKSLAGGGQVATSLVNNLFWDFGPGGAQGGAAALVTTFTQPLMRGAFRHVRLENLTQAERDLLYSVRDFARFRRLFYLEVSADYLSLLTQVQEIRNLRANLNNLRQNLQEFDYYMDLRLVTQIQRDQVFQQYQRARLSLLSAEQQLIASLDAFKFQLGLPAWVPLQIDESPLDLFELNSPELVQLQNEAQESFVALMRYLPPETAPQEFLLEVCERLRQLRTRAVELTPIIESEMLKWRERLESIEVQNLGADDALDHQQQLDLAERVESLVADVKQSQDRNANAADKLEQMILQTRSETSSRLAPTQLAPQRLQTTPELLPQVGEQLPQPPPAQMENELNGFTDPQQIAWQSLQNALGIDLRAELSDLFVAQTQIRLFLLELEPVQADEPAVISFAHQNRLDIQNSRARVMDAFRQVEVAADALESDLSVTGGVAVGSNPNKNNAFRFDSSGNRYTVGVQLDGPLNRLNERNSYRAQQLNYQRVYRDFLAAKDQVTNEVRAILRQLELRRLNFQIARQQLVAATRQFDQAQVELRRSTEPEGNLTIFLLEALGGLLDASNNIVDNWIQYRVLRMRLFTALDTLYLDEAGRWINEQAGMLEISQIRQVDSEYFPPIPSLELSTQ